MNINRRLPGCHFHACSPLRPVSAHTSAKRAAAAQSKHIYQVYHIILWEAAKAGSVLPNTWPQKRKKEKENTPIYKPFLFYVIPSVRVMELKILELWQLKKKHPPPHPPTPFPSNQWLHLCALRLCADVLDITCWILAAGAAVAEKITVEPDTSPGRIGLLNGQLLPRAAFWEAEMWVTLEVLTWDQMGPLPTRLI